MADIKKYLKAKKEGFGVKRRVGLTMKPNNNSADFIAPNVATGCFAVCNFCYVARHNKFGNPVKVTRHINDLVDAIIDHVELRPPKYPNYSNQQDTWRWTYDVGECTDLMATPLLELTNLYISQLTGMSAKIKPTFATKLCTPYSASKMRECVRPYQTRIRASLMPQHISDIVEFGTASMLDRIKAMRILYEKNYEIHINFSPIVLTNTWVKDYVDLMQLIDKELGNDYIGIKIKEQLRCEVIFLLHHEGLHDSNMTWNPEAEKLLWVPHAQEYKTNNRGSSDILRYKMEIKKQACTIFKNMLVKYLPYCKIRYIF